MTFVSRQPVASAPARARARVARGLGVAMLCSGLATLSAAEGAPATGPMAADAATAEAQAAFDRGDAATARDALRRALALQPDHATALRLSSQLQAPTPASPIATRSASAEHTVADLRTVCDDAGFLIAAGRSREAVARLVQALTAAGDQADSLLATRARQLLEQAERAERRAATEGDTAERIASGATARTHAGDETARTANLRQERLARILDLRHRGHLELALAHCRQLLTAYPADSEIDSLFRSMLGAVHDQRRISIAEREAELRAELSVRLERSMIPEGIDGMPIFPSDWNSRRSGREGVLEAPMQAPAWKTALLDRLEQRISISFDAAPAAEAVALLARIGNLNLLAAPEIAAGDKTVTLRVAGMRIRDVVDWIATQVGTRWSLSDGAIYLGDNVQTARLTAIHDISSLLAGTRDFPGPAIAFSDGSAGGQGILAPTTTEEVKNLSPDDIADLIKRSVSPSTWTEEGNAIAIQGQMLLVTASDDIQRLIREFLRAQSDQRALAVRVDARWLEVSDLFLEEIGVQWHSPNDGMLATGINDRNNGGILRSMNGWQMDGGTVNVMPDSSLRVRNNAGTGLTLQAALIGSSSYSAVLTAIERGSQIRSLLAPELTCLNGQRAHVFYGNQAAFISDYEISGSRYDSIISTLSVGTILDVRPLVSADRRYVTMDIRSSTSSVTFFTEYFTAIQIYGNSTANVGNGPGFLEDLDPDETLPTIVVGAFPIELPNVAIREAATSVTIPDKGSLIIGGFNHSMDQFTATRVPMLGSIPFLGRLFGARGRYNDRTQLCLLSTVTIINYPELEAHL